MSKGRSGRPTGFFDSEEAGRAAWGSWRAGFHGWNKPGTPTAPTEPEPGPAETGPTAKLTVTFNSEDAGYANATGWYNARTGEAGILFLNLNDDGWKPGVRAGDARSLTVLQSDLDAGNIGFFMVPNGANQYPASTLSSPMRFEETSNGMGRIVIDRPGCDVVLGAKQGEVLFSDAAYNKGGYDYVSGAVGTEGQTKAQKFGAQSDGPDGILGTMAWDDQVVRYNNTGTDRDFNDVVFTVTKEGSSNPPANSAPTDIKLSNTSIDENALGGVIGTLSTADPDSGNTHSYTVSDNRFEVVSGQLKLKSGVSLDYEAEGSVQLNVTTTDQGGLSYSESFTIAVKDVNEAPTDINLSNLTVDEIEDGAFVGALSTVDPDAGDSHRYTVDDGRFEVVNGQLQLKAGVSLDYETEPTVTVNVTATDLGGNSVTKSFVIDVVDSDETPSAPSDKDATANLIVENAVIGTAVGITAWSIDPDAGDSVTYSLSDNAGGLFAIDSATGVVTLAGALDFETSAQHTITVRAADKAGNYSETDFAIQVGDTAEGGGGTQVAVDGYIAGATVFADANGNGVRDAGEAFATTDPFGTFQLEPQGAPLVMVGGYDIATSLPFQGKLTAEPGSTVISPLTTLVVALGNAGVPDPTATLAGALGLTGVSDFGQLDPIAEAATSIDAFARSNQVLNTVTLVANLIVGGDQAVGMEGATTAAFAMLAAQAADGTLDLADAATVAQLIADTAGNLGLPALESQLVTDAAALIAEVNGAVDGFVSAGGSADELLANITAASITAQGEIAFAMKSAGQSGDSEILAEYSGAALDSAIEFALGLVGNLQGTGTAGSDGDDVIALQNGADTILGLAGKDTLSGGTGNDHLYGGAGDDTLNGENDEDHLTGGAGNDVLNGGPGADTYVHSGTAADGDDVVNTGDNGFDRVVFGTADLSDLSFMRDGNDLVVGAHQAGGPAFDGSIRVANHYAGSSIGYVEIDTANNLLYGADPDAVRFFFTADLANGLMNSDAAEVLLGSDAGETINGNGGYYDAIFGGGGDDVINGGGGGVDNLHGGAGDDQINAGDGNDVISGDAGNDLLAGGSGADTFLFDLGLSGADTLADFDGANDILSFASIADTNANGVDLSDLLALVSGITNFGLGNDVLVAFSTGASLTFQGAGTGGAISSLTDLVANPATQIRVA